MSMYRLNFRRQLIYRLPASFVLAWFLLATCIGSSSTVFAAVQRTSQQLPPQNITRAGVFAVRLLVSYVSTETDSALSNGNTTVMCTGQGVLLASQPQVGGQNTGGATISGNYQNWILTDGNLLSQDKANCLPAQPQAKLTAITIFTSTAYNAQQSISFVVPISALSITCQNRTTCSNGAALFSFTTQAPQPFIRLANNIKPSTQDNAPDQALALAKSDLSLRDLPTSSVGSSTYAQQLEQFLTPTSLAFNDPMVNSGTPLVNSAGDLTGIHLANGTAPSISALERFIYSVIPNSNHQIVINPVYENWENGMDAYYQQKMDIAHTDFQNAYNANHSFTAALHFAALTAASASGNQQAGQPAGSFSSTGSLSFHGFTFYYWEIALVALVIVVLLLLLIGLLLIRARLRRHRRFRSELADAEKQATIEAQRIRMAEMDVSQGMPPGSPQVPVPMVAPQHSPSRPLVSGPLDGMPVNVPMQRCPRCGELNSVDSNYCGHCRLLLTPSQSGALPRLSRTSAQYPVAPVGGPVVSVPPVSPTPMPPIPEQPTIVPAGAVSEQPTVIPGHAIVDHPTIDISPDQSQSQSNISVDPERTLPYSKRRLRGKRASFVVGTHSNPGIKRKYKPNEDSLFAAQGLLGAGSNNLQPFGLFVVADGMGGHANGRDASQLAIQTIVNHVLPRLFDPAGHAREDYAPLLVEGIQEANLAVHQNNIEQNGDMGTTVTSCLLVDGIAYIANVGDSRTYLYRPDEGLKKVTTDHSVVASLVEAGIIKPDDIYTHPKRNQIYRSLGEKSAVEIDAFTVQLQVADKLLLCSDGLWDMVRDPKIEEVIKQPVADLSVTSEALIQAALEGGGEDNVSVIVVHMIESSDITGMPRLQLLAKPDSVQMPQ